MDDSAHRAREFGGEARRAPVAPRVRAGPDGEILPLEHHIGELLGRKTRGPVNLYGPMGCGKSVALGHLAAVFGRERLVLLDDVQPTEDLEAGREGLIVCVTRRQRPFAPIALEMARWEEDDLIEYLLSGRKGQCKSVMARLKEASGHERLDGSAELWALVLEIFASDETVGDISLALKREATRVLDGAQLREAARCCLKSISQDDGREDVPVFPPELRVRLLFHRAVRLLLAAEQFANDIAGGRMKLLKRELSSELVEEAGRELRRSEGGIKKLSNAVTRKTAIQRTGVNLLLAADPQWRPEPRSLSNVSEGKMAGAQWKGVDLMGCAVNRANLSRADLSESVLEGVKALGTNFRMARLVRARMTRMLANEADFSGADMSGALADYAIFEGAIFENTIMAGVRLNGAMLYGARLGKAKLCGAALNGAALKQVVVDEADFSDVDLGEAVLEDVRLSAACFRGASFRKARVLRCNLEGLDMPLADFEAADLNGSYLTGSVMPGANFHGASLSRTGLAEVDWEGADLREVDFARASFHMGSSRSGLVQSVIASEGTRTGFYTDDYNDQDFKAPEEIRKANLCGCDLRGAKVEGTDFYLVDLRGAKYSEAQGRHFARCGAILRSRV